MNTTTLGYILLITIPLIITIAKLAIKRKKKESPFTKLTDEEFCTTLKNSHLIDQLRDIESTLATYAKFLQSRFLKKYPEVAIEIDQVHKRRRYARTIRTLLQSEDPTKEITEEKLRQILETVHCLSQLPTLKEQNLTIEELQEKYKEIDESIADLIKSGHLPEEYRNSSRTLSPEELRKHWMKINGYENA